MDLIESIDRINKIAVGNLATLREISSSTQVTKSILDLGQFVKVLTDAGHGNHPLVDTAMEATGIYLKLIVGNKRNGNYDGN
mmetsp:Transcript_8631/g.10014  ORF Transcript_8631/g.10014 Transcript_8631/m.10014 type:complete len:82 (-) Transcript_8631:29-274(-)